MDGVIKVGIQYVAMATIIAKHFKDESSCIDMLYVSDIDGVVGDNWGNPSWCSGHLGI